MKTGGFFSAIIAKMRDSRRLETGVYISLIALAVIIFLLSGGISCDRNTTVRDEGTGDKSLNDDVSVSENELERRLEAILSNIEGAGKVRVMITYDNSIEIVPAEESQSSASQGGSSESRRPTTISGGGKQSPIVLTEIMPRVRGVIVVAEGADNIRVKTELLLAVQTVLGTDVSRISIFSMEQG